MRTDKARPKEGQVRPEEGSRHPSGKLGSVEGVWSARRHARLGAGGPGAAPEPNPARRRSPGDGRRPTRGSIPLLTEGIVPKFWDVVTQRDA